VVTLYKSLSNSYSEIVILLSVISINFHKYLSISYVSDTAYVLLSKIKWQLINSQYEIHCRDYKFLSVMEYLQIQAITG